MMKIIHVSCEGLGNGGVQAVIMNIVRFLKEDINFDILLFTDEERYYEDEFSKYGHIYRIPNYNGKSKIRRKLDYYIRFYRIFKGTYKIIKKNGPYDAIHCHNDLESGICNLAAMLAGVKLRISHAHINHSQFSKINIIGNIYRIMLRLLLNLCSNIKVACTKEAFQNIFGKKKYKESNSIILPNPVNISKFSKSRSCLELNKDINIVHVGKYCKNKNQKFLIEILPYILKEFPNAILQLIGFGENYKKELQNLVKSYGLDSNVKFLPSDSNIKEVLDNASLFMFPSIREGFGIALLEAQAMELHCLVSDTVPKEVDCGLCEFLPLTSAKEIWGKEAINIIKNKNNNKLDRKRLLSLDSKNYAKKMKDLYKGGVL
ncbi:glycosyltransferase [Natronospora cellulosivora (SeqCode)]